jgi:hypothetical protein
MGDHTHPILSDLPEVGPYLTDISRPQRHEGNHPGPFHINSMQSP